MYKYAYKLELKGGSNLRRPLSSMAQTFEEIEKATNFKISIPRRNSVERGKLISIEDNACRLTVSLLKRPNNDKTE